ncbi:MAG: hypothetical protein K2I23_05895, partial [Clostridia bacterium]|nr:hypothetical protein [Clostridia bacterium]
NNNIPQVTVADGVIYSGDTDANGRAPTFDFDYKNRISNTPCNGYPTGIVGKYTATLKITNDCNYALATTYSIDFDINRTPIDKPSIATKESDYTGKDITFTLSQYSDKVTVTVTSANGKTASHSNGVITVKDVDTYTVRIALADNGVSTCWKPPAGQTPANDDIAAYSIEIKVKQKKLGVSVTCSDTDASWDAGESPTMTITDDRLSDAAGNKDNIDYYVYYLKSGDNTKYDYIDASKQVNADSVTVTMPNDLAIGSYTFVVELRSNSSSSHNGNYYIEDNSKETQFAVVGKGISVTPDKIKWKVNNEAIGDLTNGKLLLTYNGRPFKFSLDESNLQSMGVKIDTSKGTRGYEGDIEKTDANTLYKVTVWLCNYDNTVAEYSGSFSLHYDIQQAKYDMSGVKWNYTDGSLKYNGSMQSVVLTGLPSSLTVAEYDGNSGRNAK